MKKDNGFFHVYHSTTANPRFILLNSSTQTFYFHLCRLTNRSKFKIRTQPGWIRCTDRELADELMMSTRTIWRARNDLEINGFIEYRTTSNKTKGRYRVIQDPPVT